MQATDTSDIQVPRRVVDQGSRILGFDSQTNRAAGQQGHGDIQTTWRTGTCPIPVAIIDDPETDAAYVNSGSVIAGHANLGGGRSTGLGMSFFNRSEKNDREK